MSYDDGHALTTGQVLRGLKPRSLVLYSVPAGCPAGVGRPCPPFRSHRPPDAGPSFRLGSRTTHDNGSSLEAKECLWARCSEIGWLFTEGLFPPTRRPPCRSQFQQPQWYREWPG